MQDSYAKLAQHFSRLGALQEASAMLQWDNDAMMPSGGANARASQLSTLGVVCHELLTDPVMVDLLGGAETESLDPWQRANVTEMRRAWLHATAVPSELVDASVKASLACEMIWRKARAANDFAAVKAPLELVLSLTREVAAAKADKLGKTPYDALLDSYEPDGSAAEIDRIFGDLAQFLPDLIASAIEKQASETAPLQPEGPFPIPLQQGIGKRMMETLGFDFDRGRLDISAHPFCGGTPDDVRLTTRYSEGDFARSMMGVLHETGHALYEQGLPVDWRRQPVGSARGMSIHESQSLLMEMQACRSPEFFAFAAPILRDAFGGSGPAWEPENLHRLATRVRRGLIRVDADEATYPGHVILRYRLEQAMIKGDLKIADLPDAWRSEMRSLLGIEPPDDKDGCLQDIHWYSGAWGYFPTYTLGALTAAQLFEAATAQTPAIRPSIARGDFGPLREWLRRHVHGRASSVSAARIVTDATGHPLGAQSFERHLTRRYLSGRAN